MKTKFKTLKELIDKIKKGSFHAKKLRIVLDNDHTGYYYDDGSEDGIRLKVESAGGGYYDYTELYEICFPGSSVEHC